MSAVMRDTGRLKLHGGRGAHGALPLLVGHHFVSVIIINVDMGHGFLLIGHHGTGIGALGKGQANPSTARCEECGQYRESESRPTAMRSER